MLAAGSGKKNIQRSDTKCWKDKAVNVEARSTFCDEELAYRRESKIRRERERQRERHKEYISIQEMRQLQNDNKTFLKVTKSLYIVTNLGQLPLMLFT